MMSEKIQVPEGYKKTELGLIPEEWNIGTLENIAEINPKTDTSSLEENTNVTFLPMQNVGENGKILKYDTRNYHEVKKGYTCFAEKDVLFAKITPCMENGKGTLAINLENKVGFGSTEYHVLRAKQNGSPEFTFYLTKWEKFRKEAEKYMTGSAGQRRVSKNIFSSYKIPIPTLPEQQKIASILSKADEQIEQTEQIIEKTEILKKGLMQKLLTKGIGHTKFKKTELGEIPEEWEVTGISKCCSEIFLGLTSKVDYVETDGVPLIRASDISNGCLSFDEARLISKEQHQKLTKYRYARRGDVLISKSGSLGVCALVDTDSAFSIYESIIDLQPIREKITPGFLLWLMRDSNTQKRLLGNKVGSTVGHLNLIQFRSLKIILPPLEEQKIIASILSKVDSQIQDNQNYLTRLQELKKGLMQDLLTGKIRVCV